MSDGFCTCKRNGWFNDEEHCAACAVSVIQLTETELEKQRSANAKLVEVLDNVTASLENVLAHHRMRMPKADYYNRSKLADEARRLIKRERRR